MIPWVEVKVKICMVYKDKPHGLAIVSYKHPDTKWLSFEGVCVFTEGKLHNGPFFFIQGDGWGRSYALMIDGRPA